MVYSEIPDTRCYPIDFNEMADSSTSLDKVKEMCSIDITCFEFEGDGRADYYKCEPGSKHAKEAGMTLYVKGTMNVTIQVLCGNR